MEENDLSLYLRTCSDMFHGLTPEATRTLAFQYAECNSKDFPDTWKENKIDGIDWLYGFMRRHAEITSRTSEATSISRAQGFNKKAVEKFFLNLTNIINKHGPFPPHRIYNVARENGIHIVTFPPHCSHKLQYLDISVYGPLKTA